MCEKQVYSCTHFKNASVHVTSIHYINTYTNTQELTLTQNMHTHARACIHTCIMHVYKKAVSTTYTAAKNIQCTYF